MTLVSLIALALSFFMAMVASWTLLLPFFDGDNAEAKADNQTVDLKLKKESLLDALEDLEQDHTSGKVSSEDYQSSKAELTAEAALVISSLSPHSEVEEKESAVGNGKQ